MPAQSSLRPFGTTPMRLSPLGLGCSQFSCGAGPLGKFRPVLHRNVIHDLVKISYEGGINWFDTAEIYGNGQSERQLAHAISQALPVDVQINISTKWWPLFRAAGSIGRTINERIDALGGRSIDLYQIHKPLSFSTVRSEMKQMAKLAEAGKIKHIGVSSFCAKQMREADRVLREHGMRLASNQVKYSLLDRRIEHNGVLETAKELNIAIIAFSPLEQGILSGKFHTNPELLQTVKGPRKLNALFRAEGLERSKSLIDLLARLAAHYGVSVPQIALNWLIHAQGDTVFAIPGASMPQHAEQNAKAMRFRLTIDELNEISEVSNFVIR